MSVHAKAAGAVASVKVFFPNLDGLRFFAFFLVFLQHAFLRLFDDINLGPVLSFIKEGIFHQGDLGVSFFFTLSGFLITYLILNEIKAMGKLDVAAFYIRRALKIWPLYYFVVIFGFILYPKLKIALGFPGYIESGNPLFHALFLSNFDVMSLPRHFGAGSLNITWTVSIEEQFYLIWPLLFFYLPKRFFKYLFPAIIALSGFFRLSHIGQIQAMKFHTLSVISDMAIGGWAAYLSFNSAKFKEAFVNLKSFQIAFIYAFCISLILWENYLFSGTALIALRRVIFSVFFAFVILEQNFCVNSLYKISRLKKASELGKYTYGLYLLHPIVLTLCFNGLRFFEVSADGLLIGVLMGFWVFVINALLSYASYHFYEIRFLRLKERFTHIRSAVV